MSGKLWSISESPERSAKRESQEPAERFCPFFFAELQISSFAHKCKEKEKKITKIRKLLPLSSHTSDQKKNKIENLFIYFQKY